MQTKTQKSDLNAGLFPFHSAFSEFCDVWLFLRKDRESFHLLRLAQEGELSPDGKVLQRWVFVVQSLFKT